MKTDSTKPAEGSAPEVPETISPPKNDFYVKWQNDWNWDGRNKTKISDLYRERSRLESETTNLLGSARKYLTARQYLALARTMDQYRGNPGEDVAIAEAQAQEREKTHYIADDSLYITIQPRDFDDESQNKNLEEYGAE